MHKRILVTGGSGLIGTNLIQYLLEDKITSLNVDTHPPLNRAHVMTWTQGDILNQSQLKSIFTKFKPHYGHPYGAARTDIDEKKSLEGYRVNIQGTENVLRCIADTPSICRALIASSMLVCRLGFSPTSDDEYAPPNLYGQSKMRTACA